MKWDPIVGEELLRSIPVYFVSFLIVGTLFCEGYLPIEGLTIFLLAFILTVIHFAFMVRYRKKEQLMNPSILSIIGHMLGKEKTDGKNQSPESIVNPRFILSFALIVYLFYRYAA